MVTEQVKRLGKDGAAASVSGTETELRQAIQEKEASITKLIDQSQ